MKKETGQETDTIEQQEHEKNDIDESDDSIYQEIDTQYENNANEAEDATINNESNEESIPVNEAITTSYELSFHGKSYGAQMISVKNGVVHNEGRSFKNTAVNVIFAQMMADDAELESPNFEQMSYHRGRKLFGERAVASMVKEYRQMYNMKVLEGIDPDTLTPE